MLIAQTTADLIAAELRREILNGEIRPGAALRQEELARRFSVSRIPVREALRALERDGLVEVQPNRGAFVVRLSAEQVQEITDLRALIEGDLAARAAARMSDADLAAVRRAADAADAAAAAPDWNEADRRFHETLYAVAGRPQQLALVLSLRRSVERYWSIYGQLAVRRAEWLSDHEEMVAALAAGDAEGARRLTADHIQRAGRFLIERLEDEAG